MATVARLLPHALRPSGTTRLRFSRRRTVIVADDPLAVGELRCMFPGLERAVIVRDVGSARRDSARTPPPTPGVLHVAEVQWSPQLDNGFSETDRRTLRNGGSTVVFLKGHSECSGRMLRALHRCGLRRAVFDEQGIWRRVTIAQALIAKVKWESTPRGGNGASVAPLHRFGRVLDHSLLRLVRTVAMEGRTADQSPVDGEALARLSRALGLLRRPAAPKEINRVLHFVSSLDSGGAERQAATLAIAQRDGALETHLRTQVPLAGGRAHYQPMLAAHGIEARQAGALDVASLDALVHRVRSQPHLRQALECVPAPIRSGVLDVFGELMLIRPQVLHCWLDEPNIFGGIAGLLAGTPRIILSTRNVNPTHFPHLCKPWMRRCYQFFARQRHVVLAGNSTAGVNDYAAWLGIEASRFIVLRNALPDEAFAPPPQQAVDGLRRELRLAPDQPLIAGVMRLSIEKRPDVFVETIRRLRLAHPTCVAVIAGVGPLEAAIRRRIASLRLEEAVRLLGQRRDVPEILAAADVVLLTSDFEGTPNCLLEAMALGKAVVATDAGGTGEVVEHEHTGLLAEREDVEALSAAVSRLLNDPLLRRTYGQAGQAAVRERFSLEATLQRTLAAYVY